jgi:hypothetical protein
VSRDERLLVGRMSVALDGGNKARAEHRR